MTAAWMAYALLVGALIAVAAHALERVCRLAGRPGRWVWAGALVLTIGLVALAPRRAAPPSLRVAAVNVVGVTSSATAQSQTLASRITAGLYVARGEVAHAVERGLAAAARLAPAPVERGLPVLWISLSALVLALIFTVHTRFRLARRAWPMADLHGERVRLAPDAGPAVVGLARPEIVVPRWLLLRSVDEQRMVIAHESEHVRARDPLLLTCAWVAAAFVAWHPAVWWMLSRLRLAVELDCDERIMRTGITPRSYGALLIELAGHCPGGMRIGAPALADGSTHLKRRLLAMTPRRPKFARATGGALIAFSIALFALACDAKLPTTAEVDAMDVSAAESAAQRLALVGPADSLIIYTIDGKVATAAAARSLDADQIATIEVLKKKIDVMDKKTNEKATGEVRIVTKRMADSLGIVGMRTRSDGAPQVVTVTRRDTLRFKTREPFNGVLLINGVLADNKALESLPRGSIVSVEVTKGAAARKLYADSAAANGVISIKTRSAAPRP